MLNLRLQVFSTDPVFFLLSITNHPDFHHKRKHLALAHVGDAPGAVADGLRLIHQRLNNVLESNGVTTFQSKGQQFDPIVHEAMSVVESDEYESGTVYEESLRGYLWNGELLRPAGVIVGR
jgi:molecular chaperone GrpE (heat shock protein)